MSETVWLRYLVSCGLLILPILVWNAIFAHFLQPPLASPELERDIPLLVVVAILTFLLRAAARVSPRRRASRRSQVIS